MPALRPSRLTAGAASSLCAVLLLASAAAAQAVDPPVHAGPAEHAHLRLQTPHAARGATERHHAAGHAVRAAHPNHPARHAAPPAPAPAPMPAPVAVPAAPATAAAAPTGSNTGLPLPRFASLRADAVNLRGGPGTRYPIQWVYKRRDLPVKIEREFDVWRLVEDPDGVKGWVHQATLVGSRSFVIPGGDGEAPAGPDVSPSVAPAAAPAPASVLPPGAAAPPGSQLLRAAPQPDAPVVAVLKPGVIGRLRSCAAGSGWCRVSVRDYSGWLPRAALWGLLPNETIQPS